MENQNLKKQEEYTELKKEAITIIQQIQKINSDLEKKTEEKCMLQNRLLDIYKNKIASYIYSSNRSIFYNRKDLFEDVLQETLLYFLKMMNNYEIQKNDDPFQFAKDTLRKKSTMFLNQHLYGCSKHEAENLQKLIQHKIALNAKGKELTLSDVRKCLGLVGINDSDKYYFDLINKVYQPNNPTQDDEHEMDSCDLLYSKNVYTEDTSESSKVLKKINQDLLNSKLKDILNEEELYILVHSIGYYCKKMNPKEMMIIINKNKTVPYTEKDILKIYKNTLSQLKKNKEIISIIESVV